MQTPERKRRASAWAALAAAPEVEAENRRRSSFSAEQRRSGTFSHELPEQSTPVQPNTEKAHKQAVALVSDVHAAAKVGEAPSQPNLLQKVFCFFCLPAAPPVHVALALHTT